MSPEPATRRAVRLADRQLGEVFRALADPTRRRIVERLARGPASMTELARPFEMALPSFAQHMGALERCRLVRSRKEGRVRRYELVGRPLEGVEHWLFARRAVWEQSLDRMQAFVEGEWAEAQASAGTAGPRRKAPVKPA